MGRCGIQFDASRTARPLLDRVAGFFLRPRDPVCHRNRLLQTDPQRPVIDKEARRTILYAVCRRKARRAGCE